ncbi:hypothetical protein O0L34_g16973 [Tuta absoluta]|nr:hypothetical protein O0L34_g16973 [Tuta absoluta]
MLHSPGISRESLTSAWLHALWKPALPSSALLDTLLLATRHWSTFDAHVNQLLQVMLHSPGISRESLTSAWLHALWKPALPSSALLDTLLLATRHWSTFDAHVNQLLQDKTGSEIVNTAVRNVSTASMLCLCVLRGLLAVQSSRGVLPNVCQVLHFQRTCGDRIHVDNALKHIGANMSAEDLVIYKCATALLSSPPQRPSNLMLWALFIHLYLQRPPDSMTDTTSPCGPLFYSGLIKSRAIAQIRKKLQETITYHQNQLQTLKQNHQEERPRAPARSKVKKDAEDGVLPMLNIRDLSGESSDSSESDSGSSDESDREETSDGVDVKEELALLQKYHTSAESMCKEFLRWLDEGNQTRAMPHHADIARFIPEQVLDAAWSRELASRRPPPLPEDTSPPATPTTPRATPFQSTVSRILHIKDCSSKRSRRLSIRSPLEDIDCKDPRTLLKLVDKHLANIEGLAEEWCNEVSRLASLDSALWELVCQLRVQRALPPVRKSCAHSHCKPLTIHLQDYEWCISLGAESGIDKNRQTARSLTRRLARPRPHAARSAAALLTIARHVVSCELAVRVVERAWQCARSVYTCAPAQTALTALVDLLADRWLSHNGKICCSLLSQWGTKSCTPLQQSLCGALVSPRRLPPAQCVPLYCNVLKQTLPPHIAFSFLSKFELSRWVEMLELPQRRELLEALISAVQRWGVAPDEDTHVLLELLGVHTAHLLNPQELTPHITRCARASVACTLPPYYWSYITRAADTHAHSVPFDQLGHSLRELGVFWWEARSGLKRPQNQSKVGQYGAYAAATADLLHALITAFTAAAVGLSYSPERVALYVWSALQESWGPWITPQQTTSLLTADQHADMVRKLVESIRQVMLDCPGIEEHLLARLFEWTVATYFPAHTGGQECKVQLRSLLEELRALPWTEHQWFQPSCLQPALQACSSNSKELQAWCNDVWRNVLASTWVRGATDEQLAPLLASLLYLFTYMQHHSNTLEQATRLPWWRLPEAALEEALERFFIQYHSATLPYHDLPQFKVILFASELCINASAPPPLIHSVAARHKRATAISRWVCSACAPALSEHVTSHSAFLLQTITDIAPYLEGSEGETEELLGRAVAIMCIEPAAAKALPVWCEWVSTAAPRLIGACVSAASVLTAFEYFAALADASIRAYCNNKHCGGWSDIFPRVAASPWRAAGPLVARTRLHAAHAVLHTHAHTHAHTHTALLAMLAANIDYIENEAIVAVWICSACRTALSCPPGEGEGGECGAAARALLARLAEQRTRSLLKMVTLQADTSQPTARHRVLASLALCIVSPSESAAKAYEAACASVPGSTPDVCAWGRAPSPKHLPRLAVRLFPNHEKYFKLELDLAPEH